ncbi:Cytochrome P450, conserved site [Phytophthora cactorum]|nr:Cytochrome P450, conserved site [Phytophthora cactorum]
MLTIDRMTDKLSSSVAVAVLSGLVVLPLAWRLLVASNNGKKSQHGTRKVVRPSTTKPLLGNTLDVIGNVPIRHDWITSLCLEAKGEPVLLQSLGTPDMTLLSTPQAFEDVFKNQFDNFPKGPKKAEYLRELLGEGIFAVDHEKWHHQRKTASNLFTMRALRDSMTTYLLSSSGTNDTVDMFRLLNRFTMEAFTEIGFGVHMNCLDADKEHPFQTAFDPEGQVKKNMDVINSTIFDIVTQTLEHHESCFDPTYLRDIVVNFIIAGRDTTAQALSWFFYCLSKNPQVEAKIREEVAAKLPKLFNGQCSPSMDEVGELIYVEAALRETLRLYPSVPIVSKEAVHDTVLSDGTCIAAGTLAGLPMYALGRMPHVWGPDAAEFKPERWIDSGKLISVSAYQFVAFNAGPRLCLGKNLAMLEMKLIVASLLSKYHVELESPENVTYAISFTLPVKGQLNAKITAV